MTLRVGRLVEMATVRGEPLEVAGSRIVPVSRALSVSIGWPGVPAAGGVVWARPVAVEVTDAGGTRRLDIPDVGMRTLLGLMVVAGLLSLLSALRRPRD